MSPQISSGSGSGSRSRLVGGRAGSGHCPTCTCGGSGKPDLLQKQVSPQGLLSTLKSLETRIGKVESAQRQGTRRGIFTTKGKRKGGVSLVSAGGISTTQTGGSQLRTGSGGSGGPSFQ